ncbi:MAG: hypothetical protein KDC38_07285, partial [Planctomycetes bacterium]|nr:hypothetical protein [Planctomycetota bacterium]
MSDPELPTDDWRVLKRLTELPGPERTTPAEATVLAAMLGLGAVMMGWGLRRGCVLKGIAGGLVSGAALALLLILPHARA